MKTLNLTPGSQDWLDFRGRHFTASEASALMGAHPSVSRNDLLRAKYSGAGKEISQFVQDHIFERGHEAEATIRPLAEDEIGDELFPSTVVDDDDWLSASLDGITMIGTVIWEHKQWNQTKVDHIAEYQTCPPEDYWQVQQQLLITGAERCLYTVGNDPDNYVKVWVEPNDKAFDKLRAAWQQFEQDLASYEPPQDEPAAVGAKMETLPALHIEVTGEVTASNLKEYKTHALTVFESINTDLQTDQDFATAEQAVRWCKDVEERLDAAKQHALSQTQSIDELFRTIDDIKESARQKRLELDKLVKQRKQSIRGEIRQEAEMALADHMHHLYERLDNRVPIPHPEADFAAAMKNKRTITSLRDSVDQVLANAKIEANETADTIQVNLKAFDDIAADYQSLFPDLSQIVRKAPDDFQAAVKLRIADHKEKEEKRLEAERERIRAEEQRKAEAKAEEQRKAQQEAEAKAAEQPKAAEPAGTTPPEPAPAGGPTPPVEPDHTPYGTSTVTWTVTCTFHTETGPLATSEALEKRTRKVLADGGIKNVESVTCEKKREAA